MTNEDKWILGLVIIVQGYFGAHVAWALMQPWVMVATNTMPK